jgi:hypothetical protein
VASESESANPGKVDLNKIVWKVPYVTVNDKERLKLLKLIEKVCLSRSDLLKP